MEKLALIDSDICLNASEVVAKCGENKINPSLEFLNSQRLIKKFLSLPRRNSHRNSTSALLDCGTYTPILAKAGFTLAEVLITLGIIGVVAAMTIPNLMTNYKATRLRSQFLKTYSMVQQVFKLMEADDISISPDAYNRFEGVMFYETFKNYLAGSTDCYQKVSLPCYPTSTGAKYKDLLGKYDVEPYLFDDGQIALQDGTLLLFEQPLTKDGVMPYIWIFADLNGVNTPPNRLGYDLFRFEFKDGELKASGDKDTDMSDTDIYCNFDSSADFWNGVTCTNLAKIDSEYFKRLVKKIK